MRSVTRDTPRRMCPVRGLREGSSVRGGARLRANRRHERARRTARAGERHGRVEAALAGPTTVTRETRTAYDRDRRPALTGRDGCVGDLAAPPPASPPRSHHNHSPPHRRSPPPRRVASRDLSDTIHVTERLSVSVSRITSCLRVRPTPHALQRASAKNW